MTRKIRRLLISVSFPAISLVVYWGRLDGIYATDHVLVAVAVAIAVAIGIFFYAPLAKRVERGSVAWNLGLGISVMIVVFGLVSIWTAQDMTWRLPVVFFSIWIPVIHIACRSLEVEWSFFKAPPKLPE